MVATTRTGTCSPAARTTTSGSNASFGRSSCPSGLAKAEATTGDDMPSLRRFSTTNAPSALSPASASSTSAGALAAPSGEAVPGAPGRGVLTVEAGMPPRRLPIAPATART